MGFSAQGVLDYMGAEQALGKVSYLHYDFTLNNPIALDDVSKKAKQQLIARARYESNFGGFSQYIKDRQKEYLGDQVAAVFKPNPMTKLFGINFLRPSRGV
jgi:uncharacterized OB-fold protein